MNTDEKLKLYFFDPQANEDVYTSIYQEITGNLTSTAYSPLYLLRRHILFLAGELPENRTYKPYFSAIILSNIAISGLRELFGYTKKQENDFYSKYLGKDPAQVLGLKILRNTLEHNNYMLFSRIRRDEPKTRYYFNQLLEYFTSNNAISESQKLWLKYFKVSFTLHDATDGTIVFPPKIESTYESKGYMLIRYEIAPFAYLRRFEQMFATIISDISGSKKLKADFGKTITLDNWMNVYSL